MGERLAKKILLVGWDAADWKIINPLLDAGKMPALETVVNNGVMGNLATLSPPLSPMLWTSIATGVQADKHGILGFTEPDRKSGGVRPVSGLSRKCKAVWNILTQQDFKTNVVGWWPSHPAEPINGVCVSNFYHQARAAFNKPWPMAPGTVHPENLAEKLAELRVHPGELTETDLLPFVPDAAKIDQDKDKRLAVIAKTIAECSSVHGAATWLMEHTEWDFMAVYYDSIDHFCHGFINFHPPRIEGVPEDLFEMYKGVVESGYRFHDMMLGRLLALAGAETTVILLSDHGFHSDHLRPKGIPHEPAGPAIQHRDLGILCMKGPHIKKDERIYSATLLDIAPTVLGLFGLPVGEDMDGHVLVQAFEKPFEPDYIASWEQVAGDCGMHPADLQEDPYEVRAQMEQLAALGYIEPPSEDTEKNVKAAICESRYNLAKVYLNSARPKKALPILEELYEKEPEQMRFGLQLARCYQKINRLKDCRVVVENIIKNEKENNEKRLARERQNEKSPAESADKRKALEKAVFLSQLDLLQGTLLLAEGNHYEAITFLLNAEKANPRLPSLHQHIGQTYLRMKLWDNAERAYLKAIEIDPESAAAYHGLAISHLRRRQYSQAAEYALRAVGIIHHMPLAHYHLGVALLRLGHTDRAMQALKMALQQNSGIAPAHRWLAFIYRNQGNTAEARKHQDQAMQLRRKRVQN
ncbi:MAG: hypothetical protein DRP66_08485 [Planctomycetota bacterium]|nr:MAG: hypothetical protein DRP66_08485 [Planctomycetota bacterium]